MVGLTAVAAAAVATAPLLVDKGATGLDRHGARRDRSLGDVRPLA